MTNAPKRIGLVSDGLGYWALAHKNKADIAVHYIRADLCQPKVKPLVWVERPQDDFPDLPFFHAEGGNREYMAATDRNGLSYYGLPGVSFFTDAPTLEAAKAAAEAHYTAWALDLHKQLFEVTE